MKNIRINSFIHEIKWGIKDQICPSDIAYTLYFITWNTINTMRSNLSQIIINEFHINMQNKAS